MAEANEPKASGIDKDAIRAAARNLQDGPVTEGYKGDRAAVIQMLNDALATELVCVLRYKRHYYTVTGLGNGPIKAEFLEHAQQEQEHADWLAERIIQLNGTPDFNPATLLARSHAEYDASEDVQAMLKADLVAERVAIESYRQMIEKIGHTDPTTSHLLIRIMAVEEEHADDLRDLLA
jgi:bacterioferritin